MAATQEHKYASWERLGRELLKRTVDPAQHVSFVIYFVVAVIVFGAAGIWTELYSHFFPGTPAPVTSQTFESLRTAVMTFFPALAGSSCMQLIWAEDGRSLRAFAIFIMTILVISVFFIAPRSIPDVLALTIGAISSLVALWTWWIANSKQRDLLDPDASTGGKDTSGDLPGSLDGFKV